MRLHPDSNLNSCRHRGFTLLEVLVALVIVGLGMMAVFDQLNQMLTATARLRDLTFAHWIAEDRITELQVNGEYPDIGQRSDEIEMARVDWTYTVKISQIPNIDLRRVDVSVSFADAPDNILAEVAGFVTPPQTELSANPQATPGAGGQDGSGGESTSTSSFGVGWAPLNPDATSDSGENQ